MNETPAARHRRLAADLLTTTRALTDRDLSRPTVCDGWTVADVIDHLITTQRDFLRDRGVAPELDTESGSPADRFAAVSEAMQSALDDPSVADERYDGFFGPTTIADTVDSFYSLDLLVHGWDIAAAAGMSDRLTLDDADIDHFRRQLEPAGDNVRMPGIFGPEVDPGPNPSASQAFIAWTGRSPAAARA